MTPFRVYLFRQFDLQLEDEVLDTCRAQKVRQLFTYLLVNRDRPHSREKLATLLWRDNNPSQAKQYLRQVLWQLQSELDEAAAVGQDMLSVDADWIELNRAADFWLDIEEFERAYHSVQGIRGSTMDPETASSLENAVELYRGDLLEECHQDWCILERERLHNIYLAMLDKLVGYCEATHAYESGMAFGWKILASDKAHERTYQRLMRLNYFAGNRTAALRLFTQCAEILQQELHVEPSERTVRLYHRIQNDELEHLSAQRAVDVTGATIARRFSPPSPSLTSSEALVRLRRLRRTLVDAQQQVEQEIAAVRETLSN